MTDALSRRIPSLIQGVAPAIVVLAVFCGLPESPRWLYARGRVAEARGILARYHAQGDLDAIIVERQLNDIKATLEVEQFARVTKNSAIFKKPANRKRMAIVITMALLSLWNGQGVISYYLPPILDSVGITDTASQTGINGGLQICALALVEATSQSSH